MSDIGIRQVSSLTDEVYDAVCRLLPQLSPNAQLPSREYLGEVVRCPHTVLLVAHKGQHIHGMLTLTFARLSTGLSAHIEDVVVDKSERRRGAGSHLIGAAQQLADERGARHVELTSSPSRIAANELYQQRGFKLRQTNVYIWQPSKRRA